MALSTFPQTVQLKTSFTPFVCKSCGQLLPVDRAIEFHHPLAGRKYRLLDGIYCMGCHDEIDIPLYVKFANKQDDCDYWCGFFYHLGKFCQAFSNCMGMPC